MGWSVSIPKSWYYLKKIDKYDLTGCYYIHYYCRSKKGIYRVNEKDETVALIKLTYIMINLCTSFEHLNIIGFLLIVIG